MRPESNRTGPPQQLTNESSPLVRPGVDGVAVRRNGINPRPFAMITGRDVSSIAAAKSLISQYDAAAQSGPLALYYAGVTWGVYSILRVEAMPLVPVSGGAGGFHGASAVAFFEVRWEMVPVET